MQVTIAQSTAQAAARLADEIILLDTRAGCSDKFFRQRFMLLVKTMRDMGALAELKRAAQESEEEERDEKDEKEEKEECVHRGDIIG